MAQRPTRQKKDDRILHRGATANEIRADLSLAPFDKAVREMDKRWGVDRLPELVSVESAAKWGKAVAGLNGAIDAQDPDKVKFWVEVCLRGLTAMDAEAVSLGRPVSDPMTPQWPCGRDQAIVPRCRGESCSQAAGGTGR